MNLFLYFGQSSDKHWMHGNILFVNNLLFKFARQLYILMFKEVSSEASTKQLRKTKLLESFRPGAGNKGKIMLTDLCPQQKAKIGELVRTLQTRKSENIALEQKMKQMEKRERKYLQKIEDLQAKFEDSKTKQLRMKEELTLIKIKQQQRQQYIQHLIQEKDQLKSKGRSVATVDQFALTEPVLTQNQYVQANQKRKKLKQKQVQTQEYRGHGQRRYPNNSRSFQKIMKGKSNSQSQNNSIERGGGKKKVEYLMEKKGKSQIVGNYQNDNEEQIEQDWENNIKKNERQQNSDDDFNELAKKWLQLKQKNMSKIKQSYKKSKQKINQSNLKSSSRAVKDELPGEFKQKNITQEEDEEDNIQDDDDINDNQSFGPKRVKNKPISKSKEVDDDFDDIELNRILKSKNFSASRLLQKNRQHSQESERIDTKGDQRRGKKIQGQIQNTPNMKMSSASNTRSNQNMDFYETDLLDIVSSINRR